MSTAIVESALPTVDEFRRDARSWLAAHAEPRGDGETRWGIGSDSVAVFHDRTSEQEQAAVREIKDWHRTKEAGGWIAITWPENVGGRGLSAAHERAFQAEERQFQVPPAPEAITATLELVAPTLERFGSAALTDQFLRRFLNLELVCCQLFSEPDAGSDLASIGCRARHVDADSWLVSGQKVWTSGALQSDYGLLIARSNPSAPKHHGLTAFLVPLRTSAVEIRPIRQITGGSSFNEVFLNDVVIPDSLRIGDEGAGWKVALTMLGFERSVSGDGAGGVGGSWAQVAALAHHLGTTRNHVARQDLARLYTRSTILELMNQRSRGALAAGQEPGVVGSIAKLYWVQNLSLTSDVVASLLGPRLAADTGEWGTYAWTEHVLGAPGYRIAGGSDEIQRNIIAERLLGLPREPTIKAEPPRAAGSAQPS